MRNNTNTWQPANVVVMQDQIIFSDLQLISIQQLERKSFIYNLEGRGKELQRL